MRKTLTSLITSVSLLTLAPQAFAATIGDPCAGTDPQFQKICNLGKTSASIGQTLGTIINLLFLIAAIVALFFLVQGGIKWVTSEGDTKNVEGARNQIIAAAVGLGITFLSYLIINLLLQFFLGTSFNQLQLPTIGG